MTYTEAITKLNEMAVKNECSETEATEALERIMQAPTCDAMPKDALLATIRYLLRCLQNVTNLNETALQALEDMESTVPCDMMCCSDWCAETCDSKSGALKRCWKYYLMEWKEDG